MEKSSLKSILLRMRSYLWSVGIFSGIVNILALTSSIYMLQIYDRVLSSRSIPTLLVLSLAALWLYSVQAALDIIRARMLTRISSQAASDLATSVFRLIIEMPLIKRITSNNSMQPLRDLDTVRNFLAGSGPVAIFDLPWIPIYLIVIYILHPSLAAVAAGGAVFLICLTLVTDLMTNQLSGKVTIELARRTTLLDTARKSADVIRATGMTENLSNRWREIDRRFLKSSLQLSDISGLLSGISKAFRIILQSSVLAVGAYLVIEGRATGGIMLAASVLVSRALAPIDLAITQWKTLVAARQAAKRLDHTMNQLNEIERPMKLLEPKLNLIVSSLYVGPPGSNFPTVHNISFRLNAGDALGIIGPSAAGKSTLVRAITGVWQPLRGEIRLDSAMLDHWTVVDRGRHIGYLPQDIELFDGTIAENISRFDRNPNPSMIISAADAAGIHHLILKLKNGYDTRIGESGQALSAGQRQRIGLARALYGNPFLVVLDEPNSNLDAEGEAALAVALLNVKKRGGIVILIAHRTAAISTVDFLCVLNNGQMEHFGKKEDILRTIMKAPRKNEKTESDGSVALNITSNK